MLNPKKRSACIQGGWNSRVFHFLKILEISKCYPLNPFILAPRGYTKNFRSIRKKLDPPTGSKGLCSKRSTSDLSDCLFFWFFAPQIHNSKDIWPKTGFLTPPLHGEQGGIGYFGLKNLGDFQSGTKFSLSRYKWLSGCCRFFLGEILMFHTNIKPTESQMLIIKW